MRTLQCLCYHDNHVLIMTIVISLLAEVRNAPYLRLNVTIARQVGSVQFYTTIVLPRYTFNPLGRRPFECTSTVFRSRLHG